jgi:hypothetical protein
MDLGDKRTMEYRITAREVAEDIARELNGDSGEGSFHGVFVSAGENPTEGELADARRRLEEFHRKLVAAADLEWERTKNPMFITDLERRAARQLGLEKQWLYDPKPLMAWRSAVRAARSSIARKPRSMGSFPPRKRAATVQQARTGQGSSRTRKGSSA